MFLLILPRFSNPSANHLPMHAVFAVKLLQYGNSMFNPILYAKKFPEFRRTYIALLCPWRSEKTLRLSISATTTRRGPTQVTATSLRSPGGNGSHSPEEIFLKETVLDSAAISSSEWPQLLVGANANDISLLEAPTWLKYRLKNDGFRPAPSFASTVDENRTNDFLVQGPVLRSPISLSRNFPSSLLLDMRRILYQDFIIPLLWKLERTHL